MFSVHTETIDLLVNNYNLTLECTDTCTDHNKSNSASYKWKRDDSVIYASNHYVYFSSKLIIVNVTKLDGGYYQCQIFDSLQGMITIRAVNIIIKGMHIITV